jgi:hypothetical protein
MIASEPHQASKFATSETVSSSLAKITRHTKDVYPPNPRCYEQQLNERFVWGMTPPELGETQTLPALEAWAPTS